MCVCVCVQHVRHITPSVHHLVFAQSPESLQFSSQGEEARDGSVAEPAAELQQASKAMKTALEETQRRATKLEEVWAFI